MWASQQRRRRNEPMQEPDSRGRPFDGPRTYLSKPALRRASIRGLLKERDHPSTGRVPLLWTSPMPTRQLRNSWRPGRGGVAAGRCAGGAGSSNNSGDQVRREPGT